MKRAISFVTVIAMLIAMAMPASIFAGDEEPAALIVSTECLEDGSYFETTIETETTSEPSLFSTRTTVSGSKAVTYKNSNNATMWYVIVHGTFSYSGTSATCTKVTGSMTSNLW